MSGGALIGWPVNLAGESFYQEAISACEPGQGVALIPEPGNAHDPRAIMVWSEAGEQIGYVPRDSWVADALLDEGDTLFAVIASMHGDAPMRAVVLDVFHAAGGGCP
ncbi:HIRAN domain-containing protein [Sphingobium sp.]|uniref:HIRAN domain-containing protein n=1 Tax=Sphingobium sp. TaxID=1912891 RepID=UPI002E214347